jgi:hypothetical protein
MDTAMSLELFNRWTPLLTELGEMGLFLGQAIQADDLVSAISATTRMRTLRSDIARVEQPAQLRGDAAELELMRKVTTLTVDARAAEAAMNAWLSRSLPGDATLLATPLGCAVLADAMLPPVWDYETDVVVLVGAALAPVAQILADLGQRRIVGVVHGDGTDAAWPSETPAIIATTPEETAAAIRTMTPCAPTRVVLRCAYGIELGDGEAYAKAAHGAVSDLRVHGNTIRAFSRTWIEQGAKNLAEIAKWPSIDALDGAFAGVPMVIVAPGPSLAKNAALLPRLKGKAIICAFSHSLKPVLAAGVTPDLVLSVDPQDVRYHFAGLDVSETCLVNAATVHPALYELPAARRLSLSANCAVDDWIFGALGVDAMCPGGGSVATTALSLALRWQCEPVIFLGLDLSFTGGNYYVKTSVDGDVQAAVDPKTGAARVHGWSSGFHAMKAQGGPAAPTERSVELPGWHGGTVSSTFIFSMFHRWFVERMMSATSVVMNCTEGGAFIRGMQHLPLADVLPTLARDIDVRAILDGVIGAHDAGKTTAVLAAQVDAYQVGVTKARGLARKARSLAVKALVSPNDAANEEQLQAVERALVETLAPLGFVSLLAQREIDRAFDVAKRDGAASTYLTASIKLFDAVLGVVEHLLPTLRSVALEGRRADASAA